MQDDEDNLCPVPLFWYRSGGDQRSELHDNDVIELKRSKQSSKDIIVAKIVKEAREREGIKN